MTKRSDIQQAFQAALPIVLAYVAIGIPCGILEASIGMSWVQVLIMSLLFYSGAGQFMIPNMWLAGSPLASIVLSVSLVNTRQLLYSASLARYCQQVPRWLAFLFAATVTDESFGVNTQHFEQSDWSVWRALWVNVFSCLSWSLSNVVGVLVGNAISIPLAIASFAMTSIFICLTFSQKMSADNICAMVFAAIGVYLAKLLGLGGFAIVLGALIGVSAGFVVVLLRERGERIRSAGGR